MDPSENDSLYMIKHCNLFEYGNFVLHSGDKSHFRINCDALSMDELSALASLIVPNLHPYSKVIGVPRGGVRFAEALDWYKQIDADGYLIVDDVFTTGASMNEAAWQVPNNTPFQGVVIFARHPTPKWIKSIFTLLDDDANER